MPFFDPNPENNRGQQVETFKEVPVDEFEVDKKVFIWNGRGDIEEYDITDNQGLDNNGNLQLELNGNVRTISPNERIKLARAEDGDLIEDSQRGFEYEVGDVKISKDGEDVEYELDQYQLDNNGNRVNPGDPESVSPRIPEEIVLAMKDVFKKKEELEGLKRDIESKEEAELDNLLQTQSSLLDRTHAAIEETFSSTGRIGEDYSQLEQDLQNISAELENLKTEIQNTAEFADSYDDYDQYYHEPLGEEKEKNELRDELEESIEEAIEDGIIDKVKEAYQDAKDWFDQHVDVANPNQNDINDYVAKITNYYELIGRDRDANSVANLASNHPDQLEAPYYENQIENLVRNQVGVDNGKYGQFRDNIYDNIYSNIENDSELEFLVEDIKDQARDKIAAQNRIGNNIGPVSDVIEDNYEEFFNNALNKDYPENPNNKETFNFEDERDELNNEYTDFLDEVEDLIDQSDIDTMINNAPNGSKKEQELEDLRDNLHDLRDDVNNSLDTIDQNWDDLLDLQSSNFNDLGDLKEARFDAVKNTKAQLLQYKADFSDLEVKLKTNEIQTEDREEEPSRETVEFDKETLKNLIYTGAFRNGIRSILEVMTGRGDISNAINSFRNLFDPNNPPANPEEFGIHDWEEFVQTWENEMVGPAVEKFQLHCQQILKQEVSATMEPNDSGLANGVRVLSSVGSIWGGKAAAGAGAAAVGLGGMAALPVLAAGGGLGYIMRNEVADFASEFVDGFKREKEKESMFGKIGSWFGDKAENLGIIDREPEPMEKIMNQIQNDDFEQDTFVHLLNQTIQQQTASEREVEINGETQSVSGAARNYYERDIKNLESDPEDRDKAEALQLATALDLNGDRMEQDMIEQMQQAQQEGGQNQQPGTSGESDEDAGFLQKTGAAIDTWNAAKQGEKSKAATFAVGSAASAGYQAAFYASPHWAIVTGGMGAASGAVSGWRGAERKALEKFSEREKESTSDAMRIMSDLLEMTHNRQDNLQQIALSQGIGSDELYGMYEDLVVASASSGNEQDINFCPDGKEPHLNGLIQDLEKTEFIQKNKNVRQLLRAIEEKGREMEQELEKEMRTWAKMKSAGKSALAGAAAGLGLGAGIRGGVETADWMAGGDFETDIYSSDAHKERSEGRMEAGADNPTVAESDADTPDQPDGSPDSSDGEAEPEPGPGETDTEPKPQPPELEVEYTGNVEQGSSMIEELEQLWDEDDGQPPVPEELRADLHEKYDSFEEFRDSILKDEYKMERADDGTWKHSMMLHPDAQAVVIDTPDGPTVRFVDNPDTAVQEVRKLDNYHIREKVTEDIQNADSVTDNEGSYPKVSAEEEASEPGTTGKEIQLDWGGGEPELKTMHDSYQELKENGQADTPQGEQLKDRIAHRLHVLQEEGEIPIEENIQQEYLSDFGGLEDEKYLQTNSGEKMVFVDTGEPVPQDEIPPVEREATIEEIESQYSEQPGESESDNQSSGQEELDPHLEEEISNVGNISFYEDSSGLTKYEMNLSSSFNPNIVSNEVIAPEADFSKMDLNNEQYQNFKKIVALDQFYQDMHPSFTAPDQASNEAILYNEVQEKVDNLVQSDKLDYEDLNYSFMERFGFSDDFMQEQAPIIKDEPQDFFEGELEETSGEESQDTSDTPETSGIEELKQGLSEKINQDINDDIKVTNEVESQVLVNDVQAVLSDFIGGLDTESLNQALDNQEQLSNTERANILNAAIEQSDSLSDVEKDQAKALVYGEYGPDDFYIAPDSRSAVAVKDGSGGVNFLVENNKEFLIHDGDLVAAEKSDISDGEFTVDVYNVGENGIIETDEQRQISLPGS